MTTRHSEPQRTLLGRLRPADRLKKGPWATGLLLMILGVVLIVVGAPEELGAAVCILGMLLAVWAGGGTGFVGGA